jgi:hypothetical protein
LSVDKEEEEEDEEEEEEEEVDSKKKRFNLVFSQVDSVLESKPG